MLRASSSWIARRNRSERRDICKTWTFSSKPWLWAGIYHRDRNSAIRKSSVWGVICIQKRQTVGRSRSVVLMLSRLRFIDVDRFRINLSGVKVFGLIIRFFDRCSKFLVILVFGKKVVVPMMIRT